MTKTNDGTAEADKEGGHKSITSKGRENKTAEAVPDWVQANLADIQRENQVLIDQAAKFKR